VSGNLRGLAARVAQIPAAATAAAGTRVAADARLVGAGWAPAGVKLRGRRVRLEATVETAGGAAVVAGTPAAGWVWATRGTGAHQIAPARGRALAGALRHPVTIPVQHRGAAGAGLWDRAVDGAAAALFDAVTAAVARAV